MHLPFTYAPFILSPTRTRRKIEVPTYTCQYREQPNSPICINLKNKSIRQPTKHVQLVSLQFVSSARITFTATIHKHTTNEKDMLDNQHKESKIPPYPIRIDNNRIWP